MRFLFINQYYAPDFAATAQQMTDLCEDLVRAGHEVDVIASRALYDGRALELPANETINGIRVHRVSLATNSRQRFRHRLVGYLSFMAAAFWKANRLPRPDVVVTLTTPPLVCLIGAWMRRVRGSRFVFWVMDIYPDIAVRAGVLRRLRWLSRPWAFLAGRGLRAAHRVVVLGQCMKEVLVDKGINPALIEVIPNWSSKDEVLPTHGAGNPFRSRHLRAGRFTLMYSGNMGTCHTFAPLFESLPTLNGGDRFDFLFVGSGKKREELEEKLGRLGDKVRFLPYQDRAHLSESLSAPEAHLVTLDPRFDGLLVPSKIYGIMAAGRPIVFVGSENNEVAYTIREAGCGVIVPPDDPEALLRELRRLEADPGEVEAMGIRGRDYFERWHERSQATGRFRLLLEAEAGVPAAAQEMGTESSELVLAHREHAVTPVPE